MFLVLLTCDGAELLGGDWRCRASFAEERPADVDQAADAARRLDRQALWEGWHVEHRDGRRLRLCLRCSLALQDRRNRARRAG